jgi:hypothetical protein
LEGWYLLPPLWRWLGLITGGVDTPVTAVVLFGMLIAGVILVTVCVFRP